MYYTLYPKKEVDDEQIWQKENHGKREEEKNQNHLKQKEAIYKDKENVHAFQEQKNKRAGGRGIYNNREEFTQRWSPKENQKEGEKIINKNKFSALQDTEETEDVQISLKEGNGEETMQKETTKKWVEEASGSNNNQNARNFKYQKKKGLLQRKIKKQGHHQKE